jgi:predicted DNA-binding protein with PD1-like motif
MSPMVPQPLPRQIVHPGPVTPERIRSVACHVQPVRLRLPSGCDINTAIARAFADQGFEGGYVRLKDVPMRTLHYVMPAAAPDDSHAAWYSETYVMHDAVILDAGLHAGERDGKPFLHCHGTWRDADGRIGMGHLLPFEAELRDETTVEALALVGALLVTRPDAETNFPLFNPEARPAARNGGGTRAVLATVRPNTDLCHAAEEICRTSSLGEASVHGIGSLVGADYEDGTTLTAHASELYIQDGRVLQKNGDHDAAIDIAMVDLTGRHSHGLLKRRLNPVCVTAELLLVAKN